MFTKPKEWYEQQHKNNLYILDEYEENINVFLDRLNISKSKVESKLRIQNDPDLCVIKYPSPGNMEIHSIKLSKLTKEIYEKQYIVTPSGSLYHPASKIQSHFRPYVFDKKAERSKVKKEMAYYESKNQKELARNKHFEQLKIKVGINSMTGVTNRNVYFKSTPCYNSITSTARHNVMCGYSSIERLLMSNFYFRDYNDTINHIILLLRLYPGDKVIEHNIQKYQLYIPSYEDIESFLTNCTYIYHVNPNKSKALHQLIHTLSDNERVFIYYAHSLYHIFTKNSKIFKKYLDECFNLDEKYIDEYLKQHNINIDNNMSLDKVDDMDLLIAIVTFSYQLLQGKTLDEVDKDYPDIKLQILKRYYYLEHKLEWLNDLFDTFIFIYLNIHKPFEHPNLIRKCVILSDTDSNIFTTIFWIYWYTNSIRIDDKALQIHSLMVYFVTKFLEHILALSCKECNIEYKDIKLVSMKNEFFYITFVRTNMSKHYFGNIMIKEGVVLPKFKFDFKGKNFKGSDLSPSVLDMLESFAKYILNTVETQYYLSRYELIKKVCEYENTIIKSLKNGDNEFLFNIPIKSKDEYKEFLKSQYFNYMFWEEVFSKKYEHFTIPGKMKVVSLKYPIKYKRLLEKDIFLQYKTKYLDIYNNMIKFLKKYPKKEINLILIPDNIKIPKEILELIDYKSIVTRNLFGIYLILRSFGIICNEIKGEILLLSEIYKM